MFIEYKVGLSAIQFRVFVDKGLPSDSNVIHYILTTTVLKKNILVLGCCLGQGSLVVDLAAEFGTHLDGARAEHVSQALGGLNR